MNDKDMAVRIILPIDSQNTVVRINLIVHGPDTMIRITLPLNEQDTEVMMNLLGIEDIMVKIGYL